MLKKYISKYLLDDIEAQDKQQKDPSVEWKCWPLTTPAPSAGTEPGFAEIGTGCDPITDS